MKIYTNTIDLSKPIEKKFWVAPFSDFGIGVKFVANGEAVDGEVVLKDRDGNIMTAEQEKYGNGFTLFKTNSGEGAKTVVYTAVAPNGQETIIIQNVSDSTVFEKDEAGAGVPENPEFDTVTANIMSIGVDANRKTIIDENGLIRENKRDYGRDFIVVSDGGINVTNEYTDEYNPTSTTIIISSNGINFEIQYPNNPEQNKYYIFTPKQITTGDGKTITVLGHEGY